MLKTVAAAAFFAVPVVALSACSPNEPIATTPGTLRASAVSMLFTFAWPWGLRTNER